MSPAEDRKAARRPKFSMTPTEMIEEARDAFCARLYSYLDLIHGSAGRPAKGAQAVADALGVQARTVMVHSCHLAEAGWIEIEPDPRHARPPYPQYEFRVVHNPARKRLNPAATTAAASPCGAPNIGLHERLVHEEGRSRRRG